MSREEDRKFIRNFMAVIGVLVFVAVALILISTGLYEGESEARKELAAERAARHLEPVGKVRLTGEPAPASTGGGEEAAAGGGGEPRSGEEVTGAVCAACHESGAMNAPKIGDEAAWADRVDKGLATLVDHSANGFNNMPPQKGQASEEEIRAAILWMVEDQSGVEVPQG
ncbi:c-type cytochrome [Arhodomonas sp. AD133]|uniref:c-type cytochrome n=1 Tax=Arhodomonas sp. AD133 TaxID=3415009 RepID=UPI003EC127E3